jgi:hypothetical protein
VAGSHTYAEAGNHGVTVKINDVGGASASAASQARVADASFAAVGQTVSANEGATASAALASFTDANPAAPATDSTATILWGDGTTSAGVVAPKVGGGFNVTGSHAYAEEGSFPITVTMRDEDGASTQASGAVNVADAALTAAYQRVGATEGMSFAGVVASLTDADPGAATSDFAATILWGDGTTSAGAVSLVSGTSFNVTGAHVYAEEGSFAVSIMVSDAGGAVTSVGGAAIVGDASLAASARALLTTEASSFSGIVATFTDADPAALASDFTATVLWGDGATASGTVAGSGASKFTVTSGHAYTGAGSFPIAVTIQDSGGASMTAGANASVTDAPISASGVADFNLPKDAAYSGPLASFTDPNSFAKASDFKATVLWGDGATSSGSIGAGPGAGFSVSGSHRYTTPGRHAIAVTIQDSGGTQATAGETAIVALTPADFNGDGKTDLAVYGPYGPGGANRLAVLESGGGTINQTIGGPLDQPVSGDFDGDGKTDVAVYGPYGPGGMNRLLVQESGGGVINKAFGGPKDRLVSGDFDGDGKTDIAVYGPYGPGGLNRLAVLESGGAVINLPFGGPLDTFVAGDFDGDGKTDIAVYGPYGPGGVGRLAVLESGGSSFVKVFGGPLDQPVAGDFDGEGRTDIAVYGPYGPGGVGRLAVLESSGGAFVKVFGGPLDRFVSGDFDGDGKTDIAVFGPYGPNGAGRLAVLFSGGGAMSTNFGRANDIPLPPPLSPPGSGMSAAAVRVAAATSPSPTAAAAWVALADSDPKRKPGDFRAADSAIESVYTENV